VRAAAAELARITAFCEGHGIVPSVAFIEWEDGAALGDVPVRRIDVSQVFRADPRRDGHLSPRGHQRLAELFVREFVSAK
jgi:hypothetical protein